MCIFVGSFIETGTKLQKDVRLVKALIDLLEQDESIDESVEFLIGENGDAVRKDQLRNLGRVCLTSFLLGIWHFIVIKRKNNKIGQLTYNTWCPENGGATREYEGTMGEDFPIELDVYTLEPEDETEDTEQDAEVVDDRQSITNKTIKMLKEKHPAPNRICSRSIIRLLSYRTEIITHRLDI